MADDANASDQVESEQVAATPPTDQQTQTRTADAEQSQQETPAFTPEKVAEKDRAALLLWADQRAEEIHRKKLNEVGYGVARVPQQHRERLKQNPNLITELEAERDAFRRAAISGGVGPNGGVVQPETRKEEVVQDDLESDVKSFLISVGNDPEDPEFSKLLRYKVAEERMRESRTTKKQKTVFDVEKVLEEKLTARELAKIKTDGENKWQLIESSAEFNHPEKGAEYEGRVRRESKDIIRSGRKLTLEQVFSEAEASVKAKMFPSVSASKPRANKVSMGESSSGKVGTTANSDPWAPLKEAQRAAGMDPDKPWDMK